MWKPENVKVNAMYETGRMDVSGIAERKTFSSLGRDLLPHSSISLYL